MFEGSGNEGVAFVLDLSEQRSGEEALRRSEAYLAQAQRLSRTGSFWWKVSSGELIWSDEAFRIMGYDRTVRPTVELVFERVHPEDLQIVRHLVSRAAREGSNMDFEHRLLMPDGAVKHVHVVIEAVCLDPENREFVGTVAMEYAANNIRFNTVSPGNINTPMHAQDHHEALAKFHPIARMGEISDIVDAVLYLQNATFFTGENIRVDGGVHAGR